MASIKGGELWSGNDGVRVEAACRLVLRCLGSWPHLEWPQASWQVALNLKHTVLFLQFSLKSELVSLIFLYFQVTILH